MAHELLVIGTETRVVKQMAPVLRRVGCNVHRIPRADHAATLLLGTRFDLILARYPVEGVSLEEFVSTVRAEGSPCRDSGLLMMVAADEVGEVAHFLKRGVNRIVADDSPCDRMLDAIADLLGVAPRRSLRAVVQLELWLKNEGRRLLTVTENLSATGMLVRGGTEFPVGSLLGFELMLPGQQPLAGSVVVARHTDRLREHIDGFGGRIISFSGDGQDRLRSLLAAG
ncbi:MAG TPA: PilZ domain-containing protein [Thermoanaerobaculaceae bacterium]|nr:PilZ domain-containing protein [Thermoanaerobaculaceae bacterium]